MQGTLNYILLKPRQTLSLNLFESEKYEAAVIVQQLVGNLIFYSNFGRYEPRLAEKWETPDFKTWKFKIKRNLRCENGELITPESFKRSLERSLFIFEKKGGIPIMSALKGYSAFIHENETTKRLSDLTQLSGIKTSGDYLIFEFDRKIRSGLLQVLSFSPLGYISEENFTPEGQWKDDTKFISSGPYRAHQVNLGTKIVLERNTAWTSFSSGAPKNIIFTHDATAISNNTSTIVDAFTNDYSTEMLANYKLVPEYLNSVLLGNLKHGFFSNLEHRKVFKDVFNKNSKLVLPLNFHGNTRTTSFYPNQSMAVAPASNQASTDVRTPRTALIIEGQIPPKETPRWHAWMVLKSTLDELELPYKFANNETSFDEMRSQKYDLRIRGSSIGGGVEPWGLYIIFCSSVGINFPDPSGQVCRLVEKFEAEKIDEKTLADLFFESVERDAAILPVSHYGVQLFLSSDIDTKTFSPLLAIMKFDQISIGKQ